MKKYKLVLLSLVAALFFTACDEEDGRVLWSGELVEFSSSSSSGVYLRVNDGNNVADQVTVNLVAAHKSSPVNVSVSIVDSLTTAIAGVHYNDLSNGSATIDANSSTGTVNFDVIVDNIEPGETWTVAYAITGGDVATGITPIVTHSIQISCPSDIGGMYSFSTDWTVPNGGSPVSGNVTGTVTMTDNMDGDYDFDDMSFGVYPQVYAIASPAGGVNDICDAIVGQGDTDQYADPFTISGSRNSTTGVISLSFSNTFGDSGDVTLTPQ